MFIDENCLIISNNPIAEGIYDMWIESADISDNSQPGQFAHIKCDNKTLRRPISICQTKGESFRIVYQVKGEGTQWLSERQPGESIDCLGPLGSGFDLDNISFGAVIIGGGIGIPPMLMTAERLRAKSDNQKIFIILGFRTREQVILKKDFEAIPNIELHITTEDGSYGSKGLVTSALSEILANNNISDILACGSIPMLKAVDKTAKDFDNSIRCQVSLEERMACGVGACLGCACRTVASNNSAEYLHVCSNGPVFDTKILDW